MARVSIHKYVRCALPDCRQFVDWHSRTRKPDGTWSINWKAFCHTHRDKNKMISKTFKKERGCENKDGALGLGFVCGDPNTPSLTIDHWDGNKRNDSSENIKVLCANCHTQKTIIRGDHLTTYNNFNTNFNNLFELV